MLRAIQAGHSTKDALSRTRKISIDDQADAVSASPPSSRAPSCEGAHASPASIRSGVRRGSSDSDVSVLDSPCDPAPPEVRTKRTSDMGSIVLPPVQGTIAQMLAGQLNTDKPGFAAAQDLGYVQEELSSLGGPAALEQVDEPQLNQRMSNRERRRRQLRYVLDLPPMFEPFSRIRLIWEAVLTLASAASLALMPLAWAFPTWRGAATVTGYMSCPIFFFHMLVKLRTAVPQHGMLNRNPITVAHYYLLSSIFVTDLITAIAFPVQSITSPHVTVMYLFALRHVLLATSVYERAVKASHTHRRVLVLVIFSLVLIHWVACIWSMLADPNKTLRATLRGIPVDSSDDIMPQSWFTLYSQQLHAPLDPSPGVIYLYAVYWTLATTTTIGFGDVLPANELEVGVICLTICVSALLYSSLIAYMSNLILASDVNWTAHKQKVETIKSYMRHRKIPTRLQVRIEEYLDYLWTTQKGLDESSITSMLPSTLQQQLSLFCNSRIISTVPLFANVPEHICAAIVMQLQPRIFVPEDLIITQGDWADEMFLIFRGVVKLVELSEIEGHSIYLKDGDYFGEIAVLTGGKRMMSVRAVTYCHLYSLQQRLLERILQQYPE